MNTVEPIGTGPEPPGIAPHRRPLMRRIRWAIRSVSVAAFIAAVDLDARAQNPEALFALDAPGGFVRILELDPQTGVLVRQIPYSQHVVAETALTHDGERIIIQGNTNWLADRLIRVHPADGGTAHLPTVGPPWRLWGIDFNPVTGVIDGLCLDWVSSTGYYCCHLDPTTGALSVGPTLTTSISGPTALAVSPAGVAFLATAPGPRLHILDLSTGSTVFVGNLNVPTCIVSDLAFNSSGQLWALLHDALTGTDDGLYTLDPVTYVATKVISTSTDNFGITFGPKTPTQSYCQAKASSLGCFPALHGDGIASPMAGLGFTIRADDLNNHRAGLLMYSTGGQAATPFQGGLLCVAPPISRSQAFSTGGTPLPVLDCSGTWSVDYNTMIWKRFFGQHVWNSTATTSPFLMPGNAVQCQFWGRDPGFPAPFNSMLSDGLEFTLSP